jgi:hypothetical protein
MPQKPATNVTFGVRYTNEVRAAGKASASKDPPKMSVAPTAADAHVLSI